MSDVTRSVQGYPLMQSYIPRRAIGIQHLAKWKNDPEQASAWLCRIIGSAFQTFIIAALPGQPAAEMLPLAAQLWVDVLVDMGLTEEQDRTRIETAIRSLNRQLKEWPQVAALIEELPRREAAVNPAGTVNATRASTEAEEKAAAEAIEQMKRQFNL